VPLPLSPGFRQVEWSQSDSVAETMSPFTRQSQYQTWPGADWWEATLGLPAMNRNSAAQWIAFQMALRGKLNCFQVGDTYGKTPQGVPQGSPLVDGAVSSNNLKMTTTLHTKGWKVSTFRHLLPGDYVQIGLRLHTVLNTVNSDSNGNAVLQLWPSLRETPVDGLALILHNCKGMFRLADNKRTWSQSETRLYGISLKIVEAR
jgi:hypothetical protein